MAEIIFNRSLNLSELFKLTFGETETLGIDFEKIQ